MRPPPPPPPLSPRLYYLLRNKRGQEKKLLCHCTMDVWNLHSQEVLQNDEGIEKTTYTHVHTTEECSIIAVSYTHLTLPTIYSV